MSLVRLGFGATAALVLTLGFGSQAQGGSYVTLGYGETATKVAMLGLSPSTAQGGSYVTFGQGQDQYKYLRLGLDESIEGSPVGSPSEGSPSEGSPSEGSPVEPEPPPQFISSDGGFRVIIPISQRQRLDEDELFIFLIGSMLTQGLLK